MTPEQQTSDATVFRQGRMLDQFRIVRVLGRGGMGVVYEAEDTLLNRLVAIKLLPNLGTPATTSLLREARAAAHLNHPNVIRVHHIGRYDAGYYLVLELARGGSLQGRIGAGQPLPWPEATRAIADACCGLAAAHAAGFVHRDVKPANLMLDESGSTKVADFGLVRGGDLSASASAHLVGTPHFMSPEQCRGEAADARSDVYALGGTYFALLTGRMPFAGPTPVQVMFAHCTLPAPDPRAHTPELPPGCSEVVRKAMAKEPADRFQSADDMLAALLALLAPDASSADTAPERSSGTTKRAAREPAPRRSRVRMLLAGAGILALMVAVVVAVAAWPNRPRPDEKAEAKSEVKNIGIGTTQTPAVKPAVTTASEGDFDPIIPPEGRVIRLGGIVQAVAFSPDGKWFGAGVARRPDGSPTHLLGANVWVLKTGKVHRRLWPGKNVLCLNFAPTLEGIQRGGDDGALIWHTNRAKDEEHNYDVGAGAARSIAMPADGSAVAIGYASGALKGQVRQYAYPGGSNLPRLGEDAGFASVTRIAYAPDGDLLAAVYEDGLFRLWNPRTGSLCRSMPSGTKMGASVAFAPDRPVLALAVRERVRFWVIPRWEWDDEVRTPADIHAIAYAPTGTHLAAAQADGTVTVWDVRTQKHAHTFRGHTGAVLAVAFSTDGRVLASGGADCDVRLWDVARAVPGAVRKGAP